MSELAEALAALPANTIRYEATFVPMSKSRNAAKLAKNELTLNWAITINGETFEYSAGIGHISNVELRKAAMKSSWTLNEDETIRNWCEGKYTPLNGRSVLGARSFDKVTIENHRQQPPPIADVLWSLLSDSDALNYMFEEWADNFDYDTDSRAAEKTYNACREAGLKCIRALGAALCEKLRNLEH